MMEFAVYLAVVFGMATVAAWMGGYFPDPKQLPDRHAKARQLAERVGLDVDGNGVIRGRMGDVLVEIHLASKANHWRYTAGLGAWMPSRISAEPGRDGTWRIADGPEVDLAWWFDDGEVSLATTAILGRGWTPKLGDDVSLVASGGAAKAALETLTRLARALRQRRARPVWSLERRMGREPSPEPELLEELVGTIDGVELVVTLPYVDREEWKAKVVARLRTPLPNATRLFGGSGRSTDLGDLVLDSAPLVIQTPDPQALNARIATDAVRGPLLDELCTYTDSELTTNELRIHRTEGALDIEGLVDRALELVNALG